MDERKALRLLKKGKQNILRVIFSRVGLMVILLLIQLGFMFSLFRYFEHILPYAWLGSFIFSVVMVVGLLNTTIDPTAKITWLIVFMALPVFGGLLYIYIKSDFGHIALRKRLNQLNDQTKYIIPTEESVSKELKNNAYPTYALANYIGKSGCFPIYDKTDVTFFSTGEKKWKAMLEELEKAEKFIFMEYFIVDEGEMWGEILEILVQKAKEGVDVRVMYDGTCEFTLLPKSYPKKLKELGIKCKVFSPVTPFLSTHYNYRDHRKILVVDGHTAFNGGVNLADEYINYIEKYGHWKDTAVMLKGEAVNSFTLMFLQMWNLDEKNPQYEPYISIKNPSYQAKGYVMPYGDSPLDNDKVGERVYMDILNRAQRYVYIMTPYLILDGELETALKFAAERGVNVKIILPGVPDKKMPYALAKTHYKSLLESGVEIFEYTPGFVHAKMFLADDKEAVVGTINLDYRSLYHHFECATYMYETGCLGEIKEDFKETLEECKKIGPGDRRKEKISLRITGSLAKIIAPLM